MEDERLVVRDLHELGQVVHRLADVDVRVAGVVEDAECLSTRTSTLEGWTRPLERIDHDPPGLDLRADRPVAKNHGRPSLSPSIEVQSPGDADTGFRMEEMETGDRALRQAGRPPERQDHRGRVLLKEGPRSRLDEPARRSIYAPAEPHQELHVCMECLLASLRTPSTGTRPAPRTWNVLLHCPNCDVYREGVFAQGPRSRSSTKSSTAACDALGARLQAPDAGEHG